MNEAPQPQRIQIHEWLLLAAGSILLLHYGWLMDDAFVYFRYADNALFLGRGLVYNPGEFVEGFSSPLWMLLLLPLRWAGLEFWWIVRLVGLLSFALFWLVSIRVHRHLSPPGTASWNLPLVFLALSYPVLSHFTSGMETALVQLAAAVVALAALEPREGRWDFALAALPLLRHELLPVLMLLILLRWHSNRRFPWRLAGLSAAVLGGWLLFRVYSYASLLPNTYHLKMGLHPAQGLRYAWQLLGSYGLLPLFLLHGILLFWPRRLPALRERARLWLLAAPQILYCILVGGDWVHYRFLAFPLPLLLLSLGGILEQAAATRPRVAVLSVGVFALVSLFAYPPQLEKPALFGMSHLDEPEEKLVDSIYDANAHRRQPELHHSPWEWSDPTDPLPLYDPGIPLRAVTVEGWCHEAYRQWDARIVHRWGLTDPVLARIEVPAALSGHRYALRSFAEDLAAARSPAGGPADLRSSRDNPMPEWMLENAATLRDIEARMFNGRNLGRNLRLALSPVGRIRVDWGAEEQPNIILVMDSLPADTRLELLTGGRNARPDGELRLIQADLRRIGYECAYLGEWALSREDSRHRDFERWIVTRHEVDWLSPTLMVERALIEYTTPLDELLAELAEHYIAQEHPRPFFLTVSLPETEPKRDYSAQIERIRVAAARTEARASLVVLIAGGGDDMLRYWFQYEDDESGGRAATSHDLAPTLREAVGLPTDGVWKGRALQPLVGEDSR